MVAMSQVMEFTGVSPSNAQGVWAFNPTREAWSRHTPDYSSSHAGQPAVMAQAPADIEESVMCSI